MKVSTSRISGWVKEFHAASYPIRLRDWCYSTNLAKRAENPWLQGNFPGFSPHLDSGSSQT
jgi:hypothetical protein